MGWNSWDSYGFTIDEDQFKANATVLASLQQYGWKYAVIDEGWYMANPAGHTLEERKYLWDANGLLDSRSDVAFPPPPTAPASSRSPTGSTRKDSNSESTSCAEFPARLSPPICPSPAHHFHAADAADTTSPCPWDEGNWGIKDNAAGQAYYDSMIQLYASWGLDFLKVDCISDHPYRPTEIRQIAEAIRKTGRPIVLSLSPGPTSARARQLKWRKYAQMWRIADDHWDAWDFEHHTPAIASFPSAFATTSTVLAKWYPYAGPGSWPDADMLPEGWLSAPSRLGRARQSRETPDEQRTEFTLWAVTRSPLILRRQSHPSRRLHALSDHQSNRALHRSERHLQPSCRHRRSRPGL